MTVELCISAVIFSAGLLVWTVRIRAALGTRETTTGGARQIVDVSIIVPARNEAHNLPPLLASLERLDPAPKEVIVVDDHSEDDTAAIARAAGARVVTPDPLPDDWNGKPWACRAGAAVATGEYLLFTDADTVHGPDSLARALATAERENADLVSVIPSHIIRSAWERLQGIFQLLLLIATRAGARDGRGERRFAIGQYLLFTRAAYERIDGHNRVRDRVAEDLALAREVADSGGRVATVHAPGLMRVRMYPEGLGGFVRGWRRSFHEGLASAGIVATLELTAVIGWLMGAPLLLGSSLISGASAGMVVGGGLYGVAVVAVARWQREIGDFSIRSAFAYPLFVVIFALVSALALVDRARGAKVMWKGREVITG